MRYPPLGQRSFGPTRVSFAAGADYGAHANDEMLAFAMIETAEGMANLASIAATPGLDGLYVGPADLTLGLAQGRLAPGFRPRGAGDDRGSQGDRRAPARPTASAPRSIAERRNTRRERSNGAST